MVRKLLSRRSDATPSRRQTGDFTATLDGYEPPSFPTLVAQSLDRLGDPTSDMADVADLIALDPGASSRLLRLVNSASFSPRSPVASIHQAAMMLGKNQLEALLISVAAKSVLPNPDCANFENRRFWATAAKRALLASMIADRTDPTQRSENFTAALLQDMAIPVLALKANQYGDMLDHWHHSTDDLAELEQSSYGWHHGMVAGWMGSQWNFPVNFVDFMSRHHDTEPVAALLPAHLVSPIREADGVGDEMVVETASDLLGLDRDELVIMLESAEADSTNLSDLLT